MEVRVMEFVHEQLATGRTFRPLTVVDTSRRFAPATDARYSYLSADIIQTLERVCSQTNYLRTISVDQGTAFVSHLTEGREAPHSARR